MGTFVPDVLPPRLFRNSLTFRLTTGRGLLTSCDLAEPDISFPHLGTPGDKERLKNSVYQPYLYTCYIARNIYCSFPS